MHYSICGNENHNKKGHARYILEQNNVGTEVLDEEGEVDHPKIREVFP
jgi:hypothetical protein